MEPPNPPTDLTLGEATGKGTSANPTDRAEEPPWRLAPKRVKRDPDGRPAKEWEGQWHEFLRTLDPPHSIWGAPQLRDPGPWDDAKAFLASFEQVAKACQWPREEWVARLLPALSGEAKAAFSGLEAQDREDYGKVTAAILRGEAIKMETRRQRFRQFRYQKVEDPQRVYNQLQELCRRWLRPERHSKEQILELLILEQFLAILPPEIQDWVRECGPENGIQTAALAENFLTSQQEVPVVSKAVKTVNPLDPGKRPLHMEAKEQGDVVARSPDYPAAIEVKQEILQCDNPEIAEGHELYHEKSHGEESLKPAIHKGDWSPHFLGEHRRLTMDAGTEKIAEEKMQDVVKEYLVDLKTERDNVEDKINESSDSEQMVQEDSKEKEQATSNSLLESKETLTDPLDIGGNSIKTEEESSSEELIIEDAKEEEYRNHNKVLMRFWKLEASRAAGWIGQNNERANSLASSERLQLNRMMWGGDEVSFCQGESQAGASVGRSLEDRGPISIPFGGGFFGFKQAYLEAAAEEGTAEAESTAKV
ncbi:hypothetical protein JD844_013740 [Phrynosoma platyrhinos]|uniref:SCAN box domain-containing protein n=1 Tax=Phrynosoma platyrhinos TaxID=52577 RepID=A0ABQ7TMD1_PHRPL|nr:hypothetical protein JD844_013740 [Phrynosoma platyrhinos]